MINTVLSTDYEADWNDNYVSTGWEIGIIKNKDEVNVGEQKCPEEFWILRRIPAN